MKVKMSAQTAMPAIFVYRGAHFQPSVLEDTTLRLKQANALYAQGDTTVLRDHLHRFGVMRAHTLQKDKQLVKHAQQGHFVFRVLRFLSRVILVLTRLLVNLNVRRVLPATRALRALLFQPNVQGGLTAQRD